MKLTKSQLKLFIREELGIVLKEWTKTKHRELPKDLPPWYFKFLSKQAKEDWFSPDDFEKSDMKAKCEDEEKLCYDEETHSCTVCDEFNQGARVG